MDAGLIPPVQTYRKCARPPITSTPPNKYKSERNGPFILNAETMIAIFINKLAAMTAYKSGLVTFKLYWPRNTLANVKISHDNKNVIRQRIVDLKAFDLNVNSSIFSPLYTGVIEPFDSLVAAGKILK